jgi:hypothetical protein
MPGSALPFTGSLGLVPPLHRYYGELRLLAPIPPRLVSFAWRYHRCSSVRSLRSRARSRAWTCSTGCPARHFGGGNEISQVPGRPSVRAPRSFPTPAGSSAPRDDGAGMLRASFNTAARSQRIGLSGLNHAASHSLCTLRSQHRCWATQHSVPAWSLAFGRAGFVPAEARIEVSDQLMLILLDQACPGAR